MKFSTLFVSLLIGSAAALPLNPRSESASESTSISTSAGVEETATATETVETATETISTESVEETLTESLSETLTETIATSTSEALEATATADFEVAPSGGSNFPPSFAAPSSIGAFIGAAFVLTNNPVANQIVATLIGIDGSLTVGGVFNTGGRGSHAGDLSAVDPLFSQGALQVLGNFVFAVNAGSNTISTFLIDPFNPVNLVPFGFPVSSGGEFPISLAVSTVNNLVCVLNGGFFASINCFVVDPILGLVPISGGFVQLNLGLITPPSSIFGTASNIIFNEASTQLIISVKGNNAKGFGGQLAVFDITQFGVISSSFNSLVPAAGAISPFGLVGIPGQNAFFTADPSVGAVIFDASSGLSSIINIPNQISTCWSAFSKISNSFFVSDSGAGVITEIALDSNLRGSIIGQTPFGVGASVLDLQIGSFGGLEFLFALNPINLAINVLQIFSLGNVAVVQEFSLVSAFQGLSITASDVVGIGLWSKGF